MLDHLHFQSSVFLVFFFSVGGRGHLFKFSKPYYTLMPQVHYYSLQCYSFKLIIHTAPISECNFFVLETYSYCRNAQEKFLMNNNFDSLLQILDCQVPLGIIFKNENVNEDMLAILQQFNSYLPRDGNGEIDP